MAAREVGITALAAALWPLLLLLLLGLGGVGVLEIDLPSENLTRRGIGPV